MTISDSNLDPLDDCLKSARWPEPTTTTRARLEARWETLARERALSRGRWRRWTLAATVLLALGIGWGGWLASRQGQSDVLPPIPHITPHQLTEKPRKEEMPAPAEPLVRPPTRFEEVAFQAMVHHQRQARVNRRPEPLMHALNQTLNQPEADVAELCKPLLPRRAAYENLILSRLATWNLAEQMAALKVLQEIGSPRAIPVLDRLSQDVEFRKAAWPVALRLAPRNLLGKWARTSAPAERKEAVQELLSRREDSKALREFLRLVAHPDTRNLALEVILSEKLPPVEALFAVLEQGTSEERHTAGLVLGRVATPEITNKLLTIAKQQNFPPEVMIALLNSSDEEAAAFLFRAKHIPQARTAVRLAWLEWEQISYTSTLPFTSEIHQ